MINIILYLSKDKQGHCVCIEHMLIFLYGIKEHGTSFQYSKLYSKVLAASRPCHLIDIHSLSKFQENGSSLLYKSPIQILISILLNLLRGRVILLLKWQGLSLRQYTCYQRFSKPNKIFKSRKSKNWAKQIWLAMFTFRLTAFRKHFEWVSCHWRRQFYWPVLGGNMSGSVHKISERIV